MKILDGLDSLRTLPPGSVMSIGNFDGLHRGHARILELARELRGDGAHVVVVTFEPHPLTILRPNDVLPRLTPVPRKRELLEEAGVDVLIELPPAKDVLNVSAEEFWRIIRDGARPSHLIEGDNFNFGRGREGTIERLREWSSGSNVALHVIEPVTVALLDLQIVEVNSSLIRWLLQHGRVRDAAICLGRPYELTGTVVEGFRRGNAIGVPTANLRPEDQLVPGDGVYAGRCAVDDTNYPAAISIGNLPTFGGSARQVEAHLLGFTGDIYGRLLTIQLTDWVRQQRRFPGIDQLKSQIARDLDEVRRRVSLAPSKPIVPVSG
ncbi:MAG: riboflavin biosynthesis protein RibF [Tepidisphaeraceae bacterium]